MAPFPHRLATSLRLCGTLQARAIARRAGLHNVGEAETGAKSSNAPSFLPPQVMADRLDPAKGARYYGNTCRTGEGNAYGEEKGHAEDDGKNAAIGISREVWGVGQGEPRGYESLTEELGEDREDLRREQAKTEKGACPSLKC